MWRDAKYLLDMLNAARDVQSFVDNITEAQFQQSRIHQYATVHGLQIIGEAARLVSQPYRDLHPHVPWVQITGMRHRIVHDYGNINLPTVWETAARDVPNLIAALEGMLPADEE